MSCLAVKELMSQFLGLLVWYSTLTNSNSKFLLLKTANVSNLELWIALVFLTLAAMKYFCINHGDQRFFSF